MSGTCVLVIPDGDRLCGEPGKFVVVTRCPADHGNIDLCCVDCAIDAVEEELTCTACESAGKDLVKMQTLRLERYKDESVAINVGDML